MTIGALLIGLAAAILAVSYIARPFQRERPANLEETIDRWVAEAKRESSPRRAAPPSPQPKAATEADEEPINFCPQCGRRVAPEHRFCPGCGTELR
jgi:ribosomal protein L32